MVSDSVSLLSPPHQYTTHLQPLIILALSLHAYITDRISYLKIEEGSGHFLVRATPTAWLKLVAKFHCLVIL